MLADLFDRRPDRIRHRLSSVFGCQGLQVRLFQDRIHGGNPPHQLLDLCIHDLFQSLIRVGLAIIFAGRIAIFAVSHAALGRLPVLYRSGRGKQVDFRNIGRLPVDICPGVWYELTQV